MCFVDQEENSYKRTGSISSKVNICFKCPFQCVFIVGVLCVCLAGSAGRRRPLEVKSGLEHAEALRTFWIFARQGGASSWFCRSVGVGGGVLVQRRRLVRRALGCVHSRDERGLWRSQFACLPVGVARRLGEFSCGEFRAYFPSHFPSSDLLFSRSISEFQSALVDA